MTTPAGGLMAEILARLAELGPTQLALADGREAVSRADLNRRVNQWIDVLRGGELRTGDRVALVVGNRLVAYEVLLACLHAGLVAVPVSWRLTAPEIAYVLADSGSRAVVTEPGYAGRVVQAVRDAGITPALTLVSGDREHAGLAPAGELLAAAGSGEPAGQCSGSVMLYTSATTGHPKGVMLGLFAPGAVTGRIGRTAAVVGTTLGIPPHGRSLLIGPWYHAAQLIFSLFPLLRGSGLVMRQRFDAAATLADLSAEHITNCHLVPTQFIRLLALEAPARAAWAAHSLQRVWHGGAACPVDVKRAMIEWWGPVFTEYYAATEAGIITMIDSVEWLGRPGSVGRPIQRTAVEIVGEDGAQCPVGVAGRVFVRRPAELDFEYHNAPGKTAGAHSAPGMFTVGDLGWLDNDGYLYLSGREMDTIIAGGMNIYPAEVEAALLSHPAVRDAAVFGIRDDDFGELVMAVIETVPETAVSAEDLPEDLARHCRQRLADYKRPRRYQIVDQLPREPTGKLSKRLLRDRYGGHP